VIAHHSRARFAVISAVLSGVAELRAALQSAELAQSNGTKTLLFIDEIHRFNKSQQDALLPQLEAGVVTLIGATTENPSFALNSALLSRMRVVRLEPLEDSALILILERAIKGESIVVSSEILQAIVRWSDGDARRALNLLEQLLLQHKLQNDPSATVSLELLTQLTQSRSLRYDRAGEEHYNLASALIKSLRGSDPDASLYWAVRMIEAGEDPLFVLRRLLIFAAEDVGMADPRAIETVVACDQAFQRVGLPEGMIPLAHAVTYLALAPKSKSVYLALRAVQQEIRKSGSLAVPQPIRQSPVGVEYQDPQATDEGWLPEHYLPKALERRFFYLPTARGIESKARDTLLRRRTKRDGG
jgi:putative ATPase